jgi:hypothetical protein
MLSRQVTLDPQGNKYLVDLLGNDIIPGDVCIFSVRGVGMELGIFLKETARKLSFRVPCWWCIERANYYSVSAINKNEQRQKVFVLEEPLFHMDAEKILTLLKLRDLLINKGLISKEDTRDFI